MKVYVTKRALTAGYGIEIKEVTRSTVDLSHVYEETGYHASQNYDMGKDAFLTWTEAAQVARSMRNKRQTSLQVQLNRMHGLMFPATEPKS